MMGLAIAHEIRGQVVFDAEPIIMYPHTNFDVEKQMMSSSPARPSMIEVGSHYDWGEEITIV
jgi:hypothetical protein